MRAITTKGCSPYMADHVIRRSQRICVNHNEPASVQRTHGVEQHFARFSARLGFLNLCDGRLWARNRPGAGSTQQHASKLRCTISRSLESPKTGFTAS